MFRTRSLLSIGSLSLALAAGCGGDGDGGTGGTNGGNGGNGTGGTGLEGTVSLYMYNADLDAPGVVVDLITNDCAGTVLATQTSDGSGAVSFSGITEEWVGVHTKPQVGSDGTEYAETWAYNIKVGDANFQPSPVPAIAGTSIIALTAAIEADPPGAGQYVPDATKGRVIGATFLGDSPRNRKEQGCVTVKLDNDAANDTVRYATMQGLPSTLDLAPATPSQSGRFWLGNVAPGWQTISVYDDGGNVIGQDGLCVQPRSAALPGAMQDYGNISVVAIYIKGENPAPACAL